MIKWQIFKENIILCGNSFYWNLEIANITERDYKHAKHGMSLKLKILVIH